MFRKRRRVFNKQQRRPKIKEDKVEEKTETKREVTDDQGEILPQIGKGQEESKAVMKKSMKKLLKKKPVEDDDEDENNYIPGLALRLKLLKQHRSSPKSRKKKNGKSTRTRK